jgi:DNA-directed RNA polymerase subunit RPC12/RpoP
MNQVTRTGCAGQHPRSRGEVSGQLVKVLALVVVAVLAIGAFIVFCDFASWVQDKNAKQDEFIELHEAAMDRLDKGPESEYGPEVVEEYAEAAEKRQEFLLSIQPEPGESSDLSCGKCKKEVPSSSMAGGKCPHCGVTWLFKSVKIKVR